MSVEPDAALIAKLSDCLSNELAALKQFVGLLREEQALLTATGNADALLSLVGDKTAQAAHLAELGAQREAALQRLYGLASVGGDTKAVNIPAALQPQWKELLEVARQARDLNENNGMLIGMHWQHNQAALTALMNAANQSEAMTYGPEGLYAGRGGGRTLGSA